MAGEEGADVRWKDAREWRNSREYGVIHEEESADGSDKMIDRCTRFSSNSK